MRVQKGLSGGHNSNLTTFILLLVFVCILVDEGRDGPITSKSGLSPASQWTPFKWRFAGGLVMAEH